MKTLQEVKSTDIKILKTTGFQITELHKNEHDTVKGITIIDAAGVEFYIGEGSYSNIVVKTVLPPKKKIVFRVSATLNHPVFGKQELAKDFDTEKEANSFETTGLEDVKIGSREIEVE